MYLWSARIWSIYVCLVWSVYLGVSVCVFAGLSLCMCQVCQWVSLCFWYVTGEEVNEWVCARAMWQGRRLYRSSTAGHYRYIYFNFLSNQDFLWLLFLLIFWKYFLLVIHHPPIVIVQIIPSIHFFWPSFSLHYCSSYSFHRYSIIFIVFLAYFPCFLNLCSFSFNCCSFIRISFQCV